MDYSTKQPRRKKMKKVYLVLMLLLVTVFGNSQTTKKYTLIVNSTAKPYTVLINNRQINGNRQTLPAGKYKVTVKSNGYKDFTTTVNLNRNFVVNAKMERIAPKISTAIVEIRIPENLLNQKLLNPLSEFKIYDNGKLINGFTFKARSGDHTITVETGGLRFVSYHTFIAGRKYVLEPTAYLVELQ